MAAMRQHEGPMFSQDSGTGGHTAAFAAARGVPKKNMKGLRVGLVGMTLLLAGAGLAAVAAQAPADQGRAAAAPGQTQELDEIIVRGVRPSRNPSEIFTWLRRLLGEFRFEGYVDPFGSGESSDRLPVRGAANCVPFGVAPAVHCDLQVLWREARGPDGEAILGGTSPLVPAVIIFGFEADYLALRYQLVDNTGLAQGGMDYLRDDTLTTTTPCAGIAGKCERVMRVQARPDGKQVRIQIDVDRDSGPPVRYMFVMNRTVAWSQGESSGLPRR
jgi:hypothetical protein